MSTGCDKTNCPLFSNKTKLKLEKNNSTVLLIFQAPGKVELDKKAPVQNQKSHAAAGTRIHNSWKRMNKKRKDFDITNTVQCYPGYNDKNKRDNKPNKLMMQYCLDNLIRDVMNNNYLKIICFGKITSVQIDKIKENIKIKTEIIKVKHPCARGVTNDYIDEIWK